MIDAVARPVQARVRIDRLTALDRLMLSASRTWPQDIGALAILDGRPLYDEAGEFRIEAVRDAIRPHLHLAPRFRQLIHHPGRGLGGPLWVDAAEVDLTHHVRELRLEQPAGEARVVAAVEEVLRQRLDPARPMWEMWFLTGLPERRVGLFVRINHAMGDGIAAMAMLVAILGPAPDRHRLVHEAWVPAPWPSARALFVDNVACHVRAIGRWLSALARPRATILALRTALPSVREILAEEPATATSLDRTVGSGRRLALIRTSLSSVRDIGRAHEATVNDVLLAVTAAGLRALLKSRREPVEATTVRIYVPVSLRRHLRGLQQGNLIAQMAVPLHLGEADPGRRLADLAAETHDRKGRVRTSLSDLMVGGAIGRRLMLLAVMRQRVNVTSASIPGPKKPLHLAGAPILEVYPLLPLVANEPLAVGALSYAGALTIGIAADRDAFPDLDVLVAAMRDELHALGVFTVAALVPPVDATSARSPTPVGASTPSAYATSGAAPARDA